MNDTPLSKGQRLALRFLQSFCPANLYETIEGDLIEQFEIDVIEFGLQKARRKSLWNAIKFVRPGIIMRNTFSVEINELSMFQNNFKIAVRNLAKRKLYSFITISALALGLM